MDTFQDIIEFTFRDGFFPSQTEFGDLYPDTAKEAENVWLRAGEWISDRGALNVASVALPCNPLQNVGGVAGGMTGGVGNVTQHAGVDWFAGLGAAIKGNQILGASAGNLMIVIDGIAVEAGLDPPGAPILDTNGGAASGQISGSYAIAAVALRSTSGGKSNRSPMSNAVALKNKKLRVSSWGSIPTGTTHILLYGTRKGHGAVGPTYRILSIPPIPVANLVPGFELEYQDGDLGELAPFSNDKPPACTHCIGLRRAYVRGRDLWRLAHRRSTSLRRSM